MGASYGPEARRDASQTRYGRSQVLALARPRLRALGQSLGGANLALLLARQVAAGLGTVRGATARPPRRPPGGGILERVGRLLRRVLRAVPRRRRHPARLAIRGADARFGGVGRRVPAAPRLRRLLRARSFLLGAIALGLGRHRPAG